MITLVAAAMLAQVGVPQGTQVINPDGSIVLQQKHLSVDDVLHHHKPGHEEKEERKEARRHDHAMEKEVAKLGGNDKTFALPTARKHHWYNIVTGSSRVDNKFKLRSVGVTRY